ncbi:MAG TPA: hypothetical protein PLO20_16095, partial [Thermogutta sp.]|nr:hypothetical protein [Thermogutta sp.]
GVAAPGRATFGGAASARGITARTRHFSQGSRLDRPGHEGASHFPAGAMSLSGGLQLSLGTTAR